MGQSLVASAATGKMHLSPTPAPLGQPQAHVVLNNPLGNGMSGQTGHVVDAQFIHHLLAMLAVPLCLVAALLEAAL